MTIQATTNRVSYDGTGSLTPLAVSFPFFAQSDLVVVSTVIATGVQTTLALTTDYLVTGTQDGLGHYSNGGTVTPVLSFDTSVRWSIYRDPPIKQLLDLVNNDSLPAESVEASIDYQTMLIQRVADLIVRSMRQPDGDASAMTTLPSSVDRASKFAAYDGSGNPIASVGSTALGTPVSSYIATLLDDADAGAARTTLDASQTTPLDTTFRVVGFSDATKKVAFSVSEFTSGQTRTITLPDRDFTFSDTWNGVNDFRLSLTSGQPVTTADVTGAGTLYAVPYKGNRIALFNGARWILRNSVQFSLVLTLTSGKPYDVFCYDNSGVPSLEVLVWSNDLNRATNLSYQNGVLCKTGDLTRRYLGTLYSTGANVTEDSAAKRNLWNYYHRAWRDMRNVTETTDTWTYTTATWRQANANTANQLECVIGVSEDIVTAQVLAMARNSSGSMSYASGIGVDSTSVNAAQQTVSVSDTVGTNTLTPLSSTYTGALAAGRHTLVWLERSVATGTTTWLGDNGDIYHQSGIRGQVLS